MNDATYERRYSEAALKNCVAAVRKFNPLPHYSEAAITDDIIRFMDEIYNGLRADPTKGFSFIGTAGFQVQGRVYRDHNLQNIIEFQFVIDCEIMWLNGVRGCSTEAEKEIKSMGSMLIDSIENQRNDEALLHANALMIKIEKAVF